MSHPIPDPNPPAVLTNRLRATITAMYDRPETYPTRTLATILPLLVELAEVINRVLRARGAL